MTAPHRYEVLGRVATTRSGAVWKARDLSLDRLVALKQIASADRDRLYREAAAIAAISSEHIVTVYGVEELEDSTVLVEEWVEGATVAAVLRANGRMPVGQAFGVVRGALLGLAAAHENGLVHGDVSMTNILVDGRGAARLIDFGSVARAGDVAQPTTGAFAAPEVAAGLPATPPADVFAAAAVLAALLHGRTESNPSTAGVDGPVRDVLNQALSPQPERRYPNAAAFLTALETAAEQTYGVDWWTQAGLGAAAVASLAAVVPVVGLALGGGVATGSGALAVAGSATASTGGTAGSGLATASSTQAATAVSTSGMHTIGQVAGRAAWRSRRLLYGIGAAVAATAIGVGIAVAASGNDTPAPKANATVDQGSHASKPSSAPPGSQSTNASSLHATLTVTGTWHGPFQDSAGAQYGTLNFTLNQSGGSVSGTLKTDSPCFSGGGVTGSTSGSKVSLRAASGTYSVNFTGTVKSSHSITGTYTATTKCGNGNGTFSLNS